MFKNVYNYKSEMCNPKMPGPLGAEFCPVALDILRVIVAFFSPLNVYMCISVHFLAESVR